MDTTSLISCSSLVTAATAAAVLFGSGCGDDDVRPMADAGERDTGPPSSQPIAYDEYCAALAGAFCRGNLGCCGRPEEVYPSMTACTAEQTARCEHEVHGLHFPDLVLSDDIRYSQGRAGSAVDQLRTAATACAPVAVRPVAVDAIEGAQGIGESGCVWLSCEADLGCVPGASGATCQTARLAGDPCGPDSDCHDPMLYCDEADLCQALLPASSPCTSDAECESRSCADGACAAFGADEAYCVRQGLGNAEPAFVR